MVLGGLVEKAGLVELADEDRATLYGALLDCTARVQGDDAGNVLALWKRRGKREFDAEAEGAGNGLSARFPCHHRRAWLRQKHPNRSVELGRAACSESVCPSG